jgi:hypothetical protein
MAAVVMSPHHHRQSRCRRITGTASKATRQAVTATTRILRYEVRNGCKRESARLNPARPWPSRFKSNDSPPKHLRSALFHQLLPATATNIEASSTGPRPIRQTSHNTALQYISIGSTLFTLIVLLRVLFNHTPRLYILAQRFVLKIISKRPWTANRDAFFRVVP